MYRYLDVPTVSKLAEVSRQAMEKALKACTAAPSKTWRGAALVVRQVRGRGGRSGMRYEVRLDSLPVDLQEAWKALQSPVERRSNHGDSSIREREFWYHLIAPVLGTEKHSRERGAALAEIGSVRNFVCGRA